MNRILEVECGSGSIYKNPQETVEILKKNYGFAGKDFVKVVKEIGADEIRDMQMDFQNQIMSDDKMQKQSISLSIILTADKIATDYLFKDKRYISIDEAKEILTDKNELSENERCYLYIMDKIAMNGQRFDYDTHCEKWGDIQFDNDLKCKVAILYNSAAEEICREGGFSKKTFLSWAGKKNLIKTYKNENTKPRTVNKKSIRCVYLKIVDDLEEYLKNFEENSDPVFD